MNIVLAGRVPRLMLLALAVLLSGCHLTLGLEVDVDRNGGGTLVVSVTTDAELSQSAETAGVDPLGRMVQRIQALDGGWGVRDTVDEADGSRLVELTSTFADPAAFAARYEEIRAALDAPEARLLGPLAITVDEEMDTITVNGSLPLLLTEVAAADQGSDVAALTAQLQGVVDSRVSVRTPDTPLQTDGAVIFAEPETTEGPAMVTWTAMPGSEVAIALTAERGGFDLARLVLPIGGGVLAVLLILGGAWAQRRR